VAHCRGQGFDEVLIRGIDVQLKGHGCSCSQKKRPGGALERLFPWRARVHTCVAVRPLQEVLLLAVVCARINRPFIPPAHLHCTHCCDTIARLLGKKRPPLDLPVVCHTQYTIGDNNIV